MTAATDFGILGLRAPRTAKPCSEYLGGRRECVRGDLKIVQVLEESDLGDQEMIQLHMVNRFRWLSQFLRVEPVALYGSWLHEDILIEEAAAASNLAPGKFQEESQALGLYMLRRELQMHQLAYLHHVREVLQVRVWHNDNVLVFGPTAGGEVEVAEDVGGFPFLCNGEGKHSDMCCARLIHDRVIFEPVSLEELKSRPQEIHFVILTPYLINPKAAVRLTYNMLGLYGWVLCPVDCTSMVEELDQLGLVRRNSGRPYVALFFKHIGLPENVGADE